MLGNGRTAPWAALAERVGGTWSQLRAVRRTASRPPEGRTEGHGPDAGQWPDGSLGGPVVAYVSRSDTISARTVLQIRPRLRILGGSRAARCASPVF